MRGRDQRLAAFGRLEYPASPGLVEFRHYVIKQHHWILPGSFSYKIDLSEFQSYRRGSLLPLRRELPGWKIVHRYAQVISMRPGVRGSAREIEFSLRSQCLSKASRDVFLAPIP